MSETTTLNIKDNLTSLQGANNVELSSPTYPISYGGEYRKWSGPQVDWPTAVSIMQATPWVYDGNTYGAQVASAFGFSARSAAVLYNTIAFNGITINNLETNLYGGINGIIQDAVVNVQVNTVNTPPDDTWAWAIGGPSSPLTPAILGTGYTPSYTFPLSGPVVLSNYLFLIVRFLLWLPPGAWNENAVPDWGELGAIVS